MRLKAVVCSGVVALAVGGLASGCNSGSRSNRVGGGSRKASFLDADWVAKGLAAEAAAANGAATTTTPGATPAGLPFDPSAFDPSAFGAGGFDLDPGFDPGADAYDDPAAAAAAAATLPATAPATAAPAPATGNTQGSRFWYQRDTFGNPLKVHTSAEEALATQVVTLINQERTKVGAAPLAPLADCVRAAKAHVEDMKGRNYFAHVSPDGLTPEDRLRLTGAGPTRAVGENIAAGQALARAIVDTWLASPPHRANMLSPMFTHVGVGVASGGTTFACAVFVAR
ncbi:MAG: CAP domain-containing protein [Planctomycetes bacterium]|nr:CAP domain-containing protein [Planctomycetota bacterium]